MTEHFMRIATRLERSINQLNEQVGRGVAWLVLLMVLIIVYDVSMRKWLGISSVALQELQWHFFALIFLLGAAYTYKHDAHVRVDVLYQSRWMTDKRRAWVNLIGSLGFLLPFALLIIISAFTFVEASFSIRESSPDPGGLPLRFLLKAAIPIGFVLLVLQGIAVILHSLLVIMDAPPATPDKPANQQVMDEPTL